MADASRFGLSENPIELDLRINKLEEELLTRQLANFESSASAQKRAKFDVAQVTGIRLNTAIVGGISIAWNGVSTPDIQKYEVQVSSNSAFLTTTTSTFAVSGGTTTFLYTEGLPNLSYHIRIRAFNSSGQFGPYSSALNSKTGVATINNLASGSATGFVADEIVSFSPRVISTDFLRSVDTFGGGLEDQTAFGSHEATFGSATIETKGGIVLPFIIVEVNYASVYEQIISTASGVRHISVRDTQFNRFTLKLFRDDLLVDHATYDMNSSLPLSRGTFSGFTTPDLPPAGQHTYKLNYSVESSPNIGTGSSALDASFWMKVEFVRQLIELVELRR